MLGIAAVVFTLSCLLVTTAVGAPNVTTTQLATTTTVAATITANTSHISVVKAQPTAVQNNSSGSNNTIQSVVLDRNSSQPANESALVLAASSQQLSPEAVAFLGFVGFCLVLLIVFFICIDRPPQKKFDPTLGKEYSPAEENDDDYDSEDDAVNQFQRHRSLRQSRMSIVRSSPPTPPSKVKSPSIAAFSAVSAAVNQMSSPVDKNKSRSGSNANLDDDSAEKTKILDTDADVPKATEAEGDSLTKELSLDVNFMYNKSKGDLMINLKQAMFVPHPDWQYQVHIAVLPAKKFVFRTNYVKSDNPAFFAVFYCRVSSEALSDTYVRFRLYARPSILSSARLIGAAIVSMASLPEDQEITKVTKLQSNEGGLWAVDVVENDEAGEIRKYPSVHADSIISIGLAYSALTGRLSVEVGQAQGLNKLIEQAPQKLETYVKVLIMLGPTADRLLSQTKTRLAKGFSPSYKEKFVFQVAQFQLPEVTIGLMIYTRRRENIGWVAIGAVGESIADGTAMAHWSEIRSNLFHNSDTITRIYAIKPPEQLPKDASTELMNS